MKNSRSSRALELAPMVLGVVLLSLVASACDSLLGDDESPEIARLLMDVDPGVTVTLVTSNDFTEVIDQDGGGSSYVLQSVDTTEVTGTFDQTYSLGSQVRFYAEATGTGDGYFSMTAYIDGEERYTRVQEADESPISFIYQFYQ